MTVKVLPEVSPPSAGSIYWPTAVPTLFMNGTPTADGTTHPYTVPAGKTAIFETIEVIPSGTVSGLTLYLADGAGAGWGGICMVSETILSGQAVDYRGFYVAPAGSMLTVSTASGFASCWIEAHGLLLPTPVGAPQPVFISNNYTATGDNTLYTVPAGRTLVLLTAVIAEIAGVATTAALRIGSAPAIIPWFYPLAANQVLQEDGYWVLPAGTGILANMGSAGGAHVVFSLSGVLL